MSARPSPLFLRSFAFGCVAALFAVSLSGCSVPPFRTPDATAFDTLAADASAIRGYAEYYATGRTTGLWVTIRDGRTRRPRANVRLLTPTRRPVQTDTLGNAYFKAPPDSIVLVQDDVQPQLHTFQQADGDSVVLWLSSPPSGRDDGPGTTPVGAEECP